ncbi:MAG: beta-CASP ribonuclease aCPSF1 [archaeon]|nr:beta-CASP ribonuclease aCPSF1 [archaeon]
MNLEEIKGRLPPSSMITKIFFEGPDIVIYTKSKNFFIEGSEVIRNLVQLLRKRIEIRSDSIICEKEDVAAAIIRKIAPKEAEVGKILFEPEFSRVIIYAKKPGLIIGKQGATLKQIKQDTCWSPVIRRIPLISSKIVDKAREIVHAESKYRQRFLNRIGEQIRLDKGSKEGWVRVSFLGSAREVGRSAILLQTRKSRVLLDCGVNVASTADRHPYLEIPEFDIENLDAIIISHAHLDHAGFLPYLYEYGYDGPTYLTAPTRDIMILQQLDYIKTMQNEAGGAPYTSKGIKSAIKHSIVMDYGHVCDITGDMRLTFHNAGHILGSAISHIHIGEGLHNLVYTADFKYGRTRLFDAASMNFKRCESIIMESTYGGVPGRMPLKQDTDQKLSNIVKKTIERGGKVIIPSFAVGRAQELMVYFSELADKNNLKVPVYLDGMIWDVTAIHTAYPEFLSRSLQRQIFHQSNNPFINKVFKRIGSSVERKKVIDGDPAVIITTSGMITGGPIMEYLKHLAEDEKNTLVFVGYQAEGTLGRSIQMGWKDIPMPNKGPNESKDTLHLKMQIETVSGFGAHSDRSQLINYISKLSSRPDKIILNHGESKKIVEFSRVLHKMFKFEVNQPHNLDALRLN